MDQLKTYLEVLKKYHFWVITGFLLILGVIGWKSGVGALEQQFTENRGRIQAAFQQAGGVMGVSPHPNEKFTEAINTQNERLKAEALRAWQLQYQRQQEFLQWPREKLTGELVDAIENLEPKGDIPVNLRVHYDATAYTIPESWEEKYDLMRVVPSTNTEDEEEDKKVSFTGVVVWTGREALEDRYKWGRTPRTDEILLAQEDLWLYEALLKIIVATNNGVTEHYNAPIRQIISFDIAQQATAAEEVVIETAKSPGVPSRSSTKTDAPPTKGASAQELLNGRYVDEVTGKPLTNPKTGAVYKLVPIRMRLLMDQRYITQLCVACGNSPLMVEPRQVLFVDEEGEGARDKKAGEGVGDMPLQPGPNACYVDLRGVAYIFNPPDAKLIKPGTGEESPVASTVVDQPGA